MRPVVELKGRIVQVRAIDKGDTVGYGASWSAARPSRIAIIAVGYARRLLPRGRRLQGQAAAHVIIGGKRCPLVGRVSMDLIAVDVTDLPEGTARRGDFATLIGDDIDVDELGAAWGRSATRC